MKAPLFLSAFSLFLLLSGCAHSGSFAELANPQPEELPATVPPPPPQPEEAGDPPAPKVVVEALEEGDSYVLVSRRGEEELDRLKVRKSRGLSFDGGRECAFDSPANEVDYVIAAFISSPHGRMSEDYDPVLYAVYGASTYDGKFKKLPKRTVSCYFMAH